jgi:SPP1 gp7 family putative phage head morphogenesis protein
MLDVVDMAMLVAYAAMGVKEVKWNTNIDGRECKVCRERNGEVYPIKDAPPKAHRNCRCYLTPVPIDE